MGDTNHTLYLDSTISTANKEAPMSGQGSALAVNSSERRRSERFLEIVPLVVRGESSEKRIFWEDTYTISISTHGALVILTTKIMIGQILVLVNPRNWDERNVRVTRIGSSDGKKTHVGIEFASPSPEFWLVGAPPRKSAAVPH